MPLCDTLLRAADEPSFFRIACSDHILEEIRRTLAGHKFSYSPAQAERRVASMRSAFPEALHGIPPGLIDGITGLPEPGRSACTRTRNPRPSQHHRHKQPARLSRRSARASPRNCPVRRRILNAPIPPGPTIDTGKARPSGRRNTPATKRSAGATSETGARLLRPLRQARKLDRFRSNCVRKPQKLSGVFIKKTPHSQNARNGYNYCGPGLIREEIHFPAGCPISDRAVCGQMWETTKAIPALALAFLSLIPARGSASPPRAFEIRPKLE